MTEKVKKLRLAMDKSKTRIETDMLMVKIQALEWTQG